MIMNMRVARLEGAPAVQRPRMCGSEGDEEVVKEEGEAEVGEEVHV